MYYLNLLICFGISVGYANGQVRNLSVNYIADVVAEGIDAAFTECCPPENARDYAATNQNASDYGVFDYVIIGAGSTGSVIATRLSEKQSLNILLLEAGDHGSEFSNIPAMSIYLQGLRYNWNFNSVPQSTCCLGMVDRKCSQPRGKAIGGTSTINALMYIRGNRHDYDSWERQGNPGWSYKDVLPYFIKSENSQVEGEKGYHGKGGPWNVEYHNPESPELYAFIEANREMGQELLDYNGRRQLGVGRIQQNTLRGRRASTGNSFLTYAWNRKNLKVLTNAFVTKILINDRKEAYGVRFDYNRQAYVARASKEVILSAGAFQSPQLLMLSGIGPETHLKSLGIPVVQNLPGVGNNYQDHVTYYGLYFTTNYTEPVLSNLESAAMFTEGHGPLTVSQNHEGVSFFQSNLSQANADVPDLELLMLPSNSTNDYIQHAFHYTKETYDSLFARVDRQRTFCIYVLLLHPKSKGTVRLQSSSPYDYPLIDTKYLSDPNNEDIERLRQGIQIAIGLTETRAFRRFNASLFHAPLPSCQGHEYLSREYWYCQIRQVTLSNYHPVGTCKMGPSDQNGAVVNHHLRVHGVHRLRVADASVIPAAVSGHTNAAAVMIGEKISDIIKGKY